MKKRQWAAGE